jgi:hypothetical protein
MSGRDTASIVVSESVSEFCKIWLIKGHVNYIAALKQNSAVFESAISAI